MNWTDNAVISDDGRYRYQLQRELDPNDKKICLFVMLNPSTADGMTDDPTLRRCKTFATAWGYGRLEVVNLFSLRATNPKDLYAALPADVYGPDHWPHFLTAVDRAHLVICGWGAEKAAEAPGPTMVRFLTNYRGGAGPMCLGTTRNGSPRHPLYVSGDTLPVPLEVMA